jgi:transcriptional regulator
MRDNPSHQLTDRATVRALIQDNPWATLVSHTSNGLVASQLPVILDPDGGPDGGDLTVVSHLGRPDDELHEIGQHEAMLIIAGPHTYVSPSWYRYRPAYPTWNFTVAHLYGTPEVLEPAENFRVLTALVEHFETPMPEPLLLDGDDAQARRLARGTVGFRFRPTRFVAKAKLSQDKPPEVVRRVVDQLANDPEHGSPEVARQMRDVHGLVDD